MTEPFGYTIFADDVRVEMSGKTIIIGVYNGVLLFPPGNNFPITLEKLTLSITAVFPYSQPPKQFKIFILLPGDKPEAPSWSQDISLPPPQDYTEGIPLEERVYLFQTFVPFAPLVLKEAGSIKVRGIADGKEIHLGALRIIALPLATGSHNEAQPKT